MKPIPIIVQLDGTVIITVDEIKHIIEESYNAGVADGMAKVNQVPYYIKPVEITCGIIK